MTDQRATVAATTPHLLPHATATRYHCPLPGCPWHHDEPTTGPISLVLDGKNPNVQGPLSDAVTAHANARADRIENIARQHLATHSPDEWAPALAAETRRADQTAELVQNLARALRDFGLNAKREVSTELDRISGGQP